MTRLTYALFLAAPFTHCSTALNPLERRSYLPTIFYSTPPPNVPTSNPFGDSHIVPDPSSTTSIPPTAKRFTQCEYYAVQDGTQPYCSVVTTTSSLPIGGAPATPSPVTQSDATVPTTVVTSGDVTGGGASTASTSNAETSDDGDGSQSGGASQKVPSSSSTGGVQGKARREAGGLLFGVVFGWLALLV